MGEGYTVIPAGYRITVTSWENDADNYRTLTKEGLSLGDARFVRDLCKMLSESSWAGPEFFGNMYEPSEEEIVELVGAYAELCDKHRGSSELAADAFTIFGEPDSDPDIQGHFCALHSDLCGSSEDYYTRVVEKVVIEYIPEEIKLKIVTDKELDNV